jgi:hypothetical protein
MYHISTQNISPWSPSYLTSKKNCILYKDIDEVTKRTDFVGHHSFWENNSGSAVRNIACMLWNPVFLSCSQGLSPELYTVQWRLIHALFSGVTRERWARPGRPPRPLLLPICMYHSLTNYVEQSFPWEAYSSSASQEISRVWWNREVPYRVHKSPPFVRVLLSVCNIFCWKQSFKHFINFVSAKNIFFIIFPRNTRGK